MKNMAPVEFPIVRTDAVSDYFCFMLEPAASITIQMMEKELGFSVKLQDEASNAAGIICDKESGRPQTKFLFRNDGIMQIQPHYYDQPFSVAADETLANAEAIQQKFGGRLKFFAKTLTNELRAVLEKEINSLGVDFYFWLRSQPELLETEN